METDTYSFSDIEERSYGTASTQATTESFLPPRSLGSASSLRNLILPPQGFLPFHPSESDLSRHSSSNRIPQDKSRSSSFEETVEEEDPSVSRVKRAVQEAGANSFGVVGVDVWLLDEEQNHFFHVDGGTWVDPVFRRMRPTPSAAALDRILNPNNPEFAVPVPQIAGVGLAGYFYSLGLEPFHNNLDAGRPLIWRDLLAIVSDPFQVPYERMSALMEAGFGQASGVPFDILGQKGIVIYLARGTASESMMNERRNATFLRVAAQHIGTACALSYPQQEAVQAKNNRMLKTYRRISTKLECVRVISSLRKLTKEENWEPISRTRSFHRLQRHVQKGVRDTSRSVAKLSQKFTSRVQKRLYHARRKFKGSKLKPPPPAPWSNTAWTFAGAFLTLLTVLTVSNVIQYITSGRYHVILAPFGALLTLQFGLTASPPAQPRSVIYGQIISSVIALLSKHCLMDYLGMKAWFVVPFAASTSIAAMGKLGCPHPPAAAAVIALFSQKGGFDIITVLIFFLGNILSVGCAIVINNLCDNRQYPMYWELGVDRSIEWLQEKIWIYL